MARLNAKSENFWARGQSWYHFWLDSSSNLVTVGATLTPTYDVRQLGTKTVTPAYDVRGRVAKTLTPAYGILRVVRALGSGGVTAGAVLNLNAARATLGLSPGSNSPATGVWGDLAAGHDGALNDFAYTSASGWAGSGSSADPYRLVFAGDDDWVTCGDLGAAEDKTFTYEAWVKTTDATSNAGIICENSSGAAVARICTYLGYLYGQVIPDSGSGTTMGGGHFIADGALHHIVLTADGVNLQLYLDGSAVDAPAALPAGTFTLTGTHLGMNALSGYWVGGIAVARIYPSALSLAQVQANYAAGTSDGELNAKYDVHGLAAKTLAPTYNVIQHVSQTLTPAYDVRGVVNKTVTPTYAINTKATQTLTPTYLMRQLGTKTLNPAYDTRQLATKTVTPTYSVNCLRSQTLTLSYAVNGRASQTVTPTYNVRGLTAKTVTPAYDVHGIAGKTVTPSYDVHGPVNKTVTPTYDILAAGLQAVSKTVTPSYDVRGLAGKTLTPTYSVQTLTAKALTPAYEVRCVRTQTAAPSYDLRQNCSQGLAATYDVRAVVTGTLGPGYDIRRLAGATIAPRYSILRANGPDIHLDIGDMATRWSMDRIAGGYSVRLEPRGIATRIERRGPAVKLDGRWRVGDAHTRE